MAYHKRPLTTRTCMHCYDAYQAVDRRRLYCSSSCKVQACKATRRRRLVAKGLALPALAAPSAPASAPATTSQTLAVNLQNLAVLGTAAVLGNLGVKAGEWVVEKWKGPRAPAPLPATPLQLVDPLSWLPVCLLTAAAPRVPLDLLAGEQPVVFVQLQYLGHTLYYQPRERVLFWRAAPGKLLALRTAEDVVFVAEQTPHDAFDSRPTYPFGTGSVLKTIG